MRRSRCPSATASFTGAAGDTALSACHGTSFSPGCADGQMRRTRGCHSLWLSRVPEPHGPATVACARGMDEPITGGCGCGAVRFEVVEPFLSAGYCHCTRCQRRTGTASSANARAVPGSVRILQGADDLRGWAPELGREKIFCVRCGSALFSCEPGSGVYTGVRLGAIDGDPGVRPQSRAFVAYAAPWEPIPDDGLPRYDDARPGYDERR